ncbi:MAG: GYD domain-containing protein [Thermoleophilia bacterium]|nr:GYD domain-containing protein [Thermoleophilia bacterium]
MKTFILLATLSPQGLQTLRVTPERLFEVNREIEDLGGRVIDQWAVLGSYDFLSVIEAPDERSVMVMIAELSARGSATFETLTALDPDEVFEGPA